MPNKKQLSMASIQNIEYEEILRVFFICVFKSSNYLFDTILEDAVVCIRYMIANESVNSPCVLKTSGDN